MSGGQEQEIEIKSQAWRFHTLLLGTVFLFAIILFRLFHLQIYQGEKLKEFSNNNRFKKQLLTAPRGLILDRHREILVGNQKIAQAVIHLHQDHYSEESLKKVSPILQIPLSQLKTKIEKEKKRSGIFHPIILKNRLSLTEIHQLKQLHWDHADLQVREWHRRVYPLKENGSQFLGFIGPLSKKDIRTLRKNKQAFQFRELIGKSGLEKFYNQNLKGQNGFAMLEVDAQNRLAKPLSSYPFNLLKIEPKQGQNLILTIDKELQVFTFQALQRTDAIGPRTGAVLVMKNNGEILTMLSLPGFDPNTLSSQINNTLWKKWSSKGSKMFINKSFQEHYSPGSLFKPFVALAALEEGLLTEETILNSPGTFKIGGRVYHDHKASGHGNINVITALEKSANTFFYQIADQIGIEKMYFYSQLFGFGQKTQISLLGESPGLLPSPLWKKKYFNKKWHRGDTINISIGQGDLLTTLLQLTVAYNAIATEGLLFKPFLLKQKPDGTKIKPVVLDSLTDRIKRKHFITIKKGLKKVVEGKQGTARRYKIPSFSFSGKTGTSQLISLSANTIYKKCNQLPKLYKHHGWFISFAPSEEPEIVVAVFTENSCSGSRGSAPIARDIIQFYIERKSRKK